MRLDGTPSTTRRGGCLIAIETTDCGWVFLAGRLLFGGVLADVGRIHSRIVEGVTTCPESKGVPVPRVGVIVSGLLCVYGGLSIVLGTYPRVGAATIVVSFVVTTSTISPPRRRHR